MNTGLLRLFVVGSIVCFLVGCGTSVPSTPIHQAAKDGKLDIVERHIKAGTDVNSKDSQGWTPLHLAAMNGHVEVVKALIGAGADLNARGQRGQTPIIVAQDRRQAAVVEILDKAGKAGERPLIDGGLGVSGVLDSF